MYFSPCFMDRNSGKLTFPGLQIQLWWTVEMTDEGCAGTLGGGGALRNVTVDTHVWGDLARVRFAAPR